MGRSRTGWNRVSWVAIGLASGLAPRVARADNTEPFFYSDDAAMTGGAVVAVTRDAGAIWYNPAGLGGVKRGQIDLSGSAFGVRIRNVPNALGTNLPGGRQSVSLDSADIFSAPHAIGLVRHLSDEVAMGFGLFITARDIRTAQSQVDVSGPALTDPTVTGRYRQRLDLSIDETRYHVGPAIGWQISPGLRIGASLFATYGKQNGFTQYALAAEADTPAGPSRQAALAQVRLAFSYFGVQPQAGIQWEPTSDGSLGLLVRAPELLLSSSADGASLQTSGAIVPGQPGEAQFLLEKPAVSFPAFTMVAPARFIAAAARRVSPRTWMSAELDVQAPFRNSGIEQSTVINARAGGRFAISDKLSAGVGIFSDRAPEPRLGSNFTDERVDHYGIATGLELRTPLSLTENPAADALVLSTTVAVKYAIGFGSVRAEEIDVVSTGPVPVREVDVVYHTIVPYIGSGILF